MIKAVFVFRQIPASLCHVVCGQAKAGAGELELRKPGQGGEGLGRKITGGVPLG